MAREGTEPRVQRLHARLREGASPQRDEELRDLLGLPAETEDRETARALVRAVAKVRIEAIAVAVDRRTDTRPTLEPKPVATADTSFLGRLRTGGGGEAAGLIGKLDDVPTLLAVLRAGSLRQRRAAAVRLSERLAEPKGVPADVLKNAVAALARHRDVELAYELSRLRETLGGAAGREAKEEHEQWSKLCEKVAGSVSAFWESEGTEPIAALPGEERAPLLLRVRDLPDALLEHLSACIEGGDGVSDRTARLELLTSLRYAGDPRLVPAVRDVLDGSDALLAVEAARVLGRIDDPRVQPALRAAFERTVVESHRAVIAGALGLAGDFRGAKVLRALLSSDAPEILQSALEGLAGAGSTEDTEAIVLVLDRDEPAVLAAAVRALGRIGDARAIPALARLRTRVTRSSLRAEIEEADAAIRARLELRGEEPPAPSTAVVRLHDATADAARAALRDPAGVRFRAWKDFVIGSVWLTLGAFERAVARFEAAAARRPTWVRPLTAMALAYARRDRFAQALAAFRRAIEVDRERVEASPTVVRAAAHCFLRRAEEVARDGRTEIARGLLEEALSLDLRLAPTSLRFEMGRRHDAMRLRSSA